MSIIVRLIFLVLCMCGLSLAFTNVQLGARRQLQLKMSAKNPSPQNLKHRMVEKLIGNAMQVGSIASIAAAGAALSNAAVAHAADEEPLFIETESGLKYRDTKTGEGESPVPGDTVRVHYTGWLDGFNSEKKFDSSYDRRSPLVFKAGVKQVIAGWDEALLTNFKVGGKRLVVIPPALGYGARGAGGVIPPNATLYFTMELVGIGAKPNR
mmetsp:Transcript_15014/g.24973  ORF Transcript_15014/g.24973 Transcript_15014/m.24973 type:complete len:210 (-) Transcript_15014:614-1243(-)